MRGAEEEQRVTAVHHHNSVKVRMQWNKVIEDILQDSSRIRQLTLEVADSTPFVQD